MCRNPRDFYGQDLLGELSTKFSFFFFFPYFCSNIKMMSISLCTYVLIYISLFCSLCLFLFYMTQTTAPIMALEEDHDGVLLQPFTFAFNAMAVCAGGGHLKRRHVVKLLESINQSPVQTHNIGKDTFPSIPKNKIKQQHEMPH